MTLETLPEPELQRAQGLPPLVDARPGYLFAYMTSLVVCSLTHGSTALFYT